VRQESDILKSSIGFFISAIIFYTLNAVYPVPDMDQMDSIDVYGTFTEVEARRVGITPLDEGSCAFGITDIPIEGDASKKPVVGEKGV
jgi:NCS1 family nucleobase:cation symporter-1